MLTTLLGVALLSFGLPVLAQSDELAVTAANSGLGSNDLVTIIGTVIKVFLGVLGIIFLILVLYSGFLWMTAGGDDKQVERAKKILINGVVGLVIMMFSYAITSFVINALLDATGANDGNNQNGSVTIPMFSGSLGKAVRDHYPLRDQTYVARNTNITVTFRDQIELKSLIAGYDNGGTPLDVADDVPSTALNAENVKIFGVVDGEEVAVTDVEVYFTDDLKTFVFNPINYLGTTTGPVGYTVRLENGIRNVSEQPVFVGVDGGGYEWSFETGVNLDLDPPTVLSVTPVANGTYAKNIIVQVTFDEPVDPISASGIRDPRRGFSNLQVTGTSGVPTEGQYIISNGYKTVTFESSASCGINSCGEQIFCLPGGQAVTATVKAATVGTSPPQALGFPYDGVVDMAANSLDADGNGTAGDSHVWNFTTTNEIYLLGSSLQSISPDITAENVALDQNITLEFSDILMSSTVNSDNITLTNQEVVSETSHEQWFRFNTASLTADGLEVENNTMIPAKTLVTMPHGVLLESTDGKTYVYGVNVSQGVRNQYQNCYLPAQGPNASGGMCGVTAANPYCCNGVAQATECTLF
ncbi:MAG: hypothetical protein WAZ14_02230 [Patescibacteria group bacterium]